MSLTIRDITIANFTGLKPASSKIIKTIEVPNAQEQRFTSGVQTPTVDIDFYTTGTNANVIPQQLQEMIDNPLMRFAYIGFPTGYWGGRSGFYLLEKLTQQPTPEYLYYVPCTLTATFLGGSNLRMSTYWWGNAVETTSGFSAPTATEMISLPNGVTAIDSPTASVLGTRATKDAGSITILDNPTRSNILYTSNATISNWFLGECKVFDSVIAGDSTLANWIQVYATNHPFTGDAIFENELLRYKIASGVGTWYVFDGTSWVSIGTLTTQDASSNSYAIGNFDIIRYTSEEIRWEETRYYSYYVMTLVFTLRRGAYHCRVQLTSSAVGNNQTSVRLTKTGGFTQLFNAGANGAANAGSLAQQTSSNYECGYNTTDQLVAGFALTYQPTYQPYDPGSGGNYFPESNGGGSDTWGASTLRTFFIIGFPQTTDKVLNPGFENGLTSWSTSGGVIAADTTYKHSGTQSAKLTYSGSQPTINQTISVTPGDVITFQFWCRGDGTNVGWYYVYDLTNSAFIIGATSTGNATTNFVAVQANFTVPAGCTSVQPTFYQPTNGGILWIDDVLMFDLTTGKSYAAEIAAQCLYSMNQELILPKRGFRM